MQQSLMHAKPHATKRSFYNQENVLQFSSEQEGTIEDGRKAKTSLGSLGDFQRKDKLTEGFLY